MPEFVSDRKLYLNADKSAVVEADSPEAAYVLVGEGGTVSAEDAEKYGLTAPRTKYGATMSAAEYQERIAAAAEAGEPAPVAGIDDDDARRIRAGESITQIEAERAAAATEEKAKAAPAETKAKRAAPEDKGQ